MVFNYGMTLVVDVGNSNIVVALFDGQSLCQRFRLRSVAKKTEDEYLILMRAMLRDRSIDVESIERVMICSVVPCLNASMMAMAERLCAAPRFILGPELYPKLPIQVLNPREIGSDLVANLLASWTDKNEACIVADFGTALTFSAVDANGIVQGVAILPGLETAAQALSRDTAQLPFVALTSPDSYLGKNTIHAIQSGIVLGYAGLAKQMIEGFSNELGGRPRAIATGGLCRIVAEKAKCFDVIDPDLTLRGIYAASRYV